MDNRMIEKRFIGLLALALLVMGITGCAQRPYPNQGYYPQTLHRSYVVPANYVIGIPRRVVTESHPIYSTGSYLVPTLGYPY